MRNSEEVIEKVMANSVSAYCYRLCYNAAIVIGTGVWFSNQDFTLSSSVVIVMIWGPTKRFPSCNVMLPIVVFVSLSLLFSTAYFPINYKLLMPKHRMFQW